MKIKSYGFWNITEQNNNIGSDYKLVNSFIYFSFLIIVICSQYTGTTNESIWGTGEVLCNLITTVGLEKKT